MYIFLLGIIFLFRLKYILSNKIQNNIYLSKIQQTKIISIIQNKETSIMLRNKLNIILYKYYEHWAVHQAYCFKQLHKYKCKAIPIEEFILSSKMGLYQACKKYNGKSKFSSYASTYIRGELYKALTDLHILTNVPKKDRKKSKINFNIEEKLQHKKKLKTTLFSKTEEFIVDKFGTLSATPYEKIEHTHSYLDLWYQINDILNTLDPFSKLCFHYKLDEHFNTIRTNKEISELLGCSEEYVRKKIANVKKIITQKVNI